MTTLVINGRNEVASIDNKGNITLVHSSQDVALSGAVTGVVATVRAKRVFTPERHLTGKEVFLAFRLCERIEAQFRVPIYRA